MLTTDLKKVSATQILLSIGGLITIIGVISFIALNWQGWNTPARLSAIFLPMLALYITGFYLWTKDAAKERSMTILATASLIFPFFLTILFRELDLFALTPEGVKDMGLTITLTTSILYIVLGVLFKHPSWLLLIGIAVLAFVGNFLAKYVNPETFYEANIIGWSFLLVSALYIVVGFIFEQQKKAAFSRYPFVLGFLVMYFSLSFLGFTGGLLNPFGKPFDTTPFMSGASTSVTGLLFLAIAYLADKTKGQNFEELPKYARFFNLFGAANVLGGISRLGYGGKEFIYETLLLLASLGFIFASKWRGSLSWLYIGAIFLVIYLFGLGAEYFQDKVGWPITIVIAGLLSMGVALLVQKLRGETKKSI